MLFKVVGLTGGGRAPALQESKGEVQTEVRWQRHTRTRTREEKEGTNMGMAKLNVWVTDTDDPCSMSNRTWYVTIYDCDGKALEWCGRRYVVMPAKCGHLEVEIPPGCYRVNAVWSFSLAGGIYYVNHFTDSAVVQACCDETTCVTLFNPSTHRCGTIFLRAVRDLLEQKAIKPAVARQVEVALNELLQQLPRPLKEFELGHLDEIEKLVREQEAKRGEQEGKRG